MSLARLVRTAVAVPVRALGGDIIGPRTRAELDTLRACVDDGPDLLTSLAPLLVSGTVLQVGANDGEDTLGALIAEYDLSAVLIEPQPGCLARLQKKYEANPKVRVETAAIAAQAGQVTLYCFSPDQVNRERLDVFSSFDHLPLE